MVRRSIVWCRVVLMVVVVVVKGGRWRYVGELIDMGTSYLMGKVGRGLEILGSM
jgi:hypothetical protein